MRVGLFRRPLMCDPPSAGAVAALAGKLAGIDGPVNARELQCFEDVFSVPPGQRERLARLVRRFGGSKADIQPYLTRLGSLHGKRPRVLQWVMAGLEAVAAADAPVSLVEKELLEQVSDAWRLPVQALPEAATLEQSGEEAVRSKPG